MRIAHLCLSSFYIDGYNYQENVLPRINHQDGNDVIILASTETYIDNIKYGYKEAGIYNTEYGVCLKRLPYRKVLTPSITHKVRSYIGLYEALSDFNPDVIFSHGLTYWSFLEVSKYVKDHPLVVLYADTHAASYNSGTSLISRIFLHKVFYHHIIQKVLPDIKKVFYIGEEERIFAHKFYNIPNQIMEFYPLGGEILSDSEYDEIRKKRRKELELDDDIHLYVHSGKMNKEKRTIELVNAFISTEDKKAQLIIIGSLSNDIEKELIEIINQDCRVRYLGWKSSKELQEYLCAGDIYCQPGSVSATMQNAVCRYCAIMSYPHLPYTHDFDYGNILWVSTVKEMEDAFKTIADSPEIINQLRENSKKCAHELLDYRVLAARIYR